MTIKEKLLTGNYILIANRWIGVGGYSKVTYLNDVDPGTEYHAIHKKHELILDAYLKDNSVEIEFSFVNNLWSTHGSDFIVAYDENLEYRLKQTNKETIKAPNSDVQFIKPEFECELLKEVDGHTFGFVLGTTNQNIPERWNKHGKSYSKKFNLTPYIEPKQWYEDESNIGKLLKYTKVENIYGTFREYKNGKIYLKLNSNGYHSDDFKLATNEEIDALKVIK